MQKNVGKQATQQLNLDISKALPIVCDNEECDSDMFMPAMKFRKVSKLLAGTPNDQIIPIQIFLCTACGQIPKEFDLEIN